MYRDKKVRNLFHERGVESWRGESIGLARLALEEKRRPRVRRHHDRVCTEPGGCLQAEVDLEQTWNRKGKVLFPALAK